MRTKIDPVTGRKKYVQRVINIIPKCARLRINPRRYAIEVFVSDSSKKIKRGQKVLDAGAGPCPYKELFSHAHYEATDFTDEHNMMDFVCSLDKIPQKDKTYDAILCTEVIEHVEYPQKVINELCRVLKSGGKLFLTCPQGWMLHQKPYNFYYFTKYGLESLLNNAGFKKYTIKPMGGYFWFLADAIRFNSVLDQYRKIWPIYYPLKLIEFALAKTFFPLALFYLDFIDRERDWTMGYCVEAVKN